MVLCSGEVKYTSGNMENTAKRSAAHLRYGFWVKEKTDEADGGESGNGYVGSWGSMFRAAAGGSVGGGAGEDSVGGAEKSDSEAAETAEDAGAVVSES